MYPCKKKQTTVMIARSPGGKLKLSTMIGNAYSKAKQAVSAFLGKEKKNKYTSVARSIYLSAAAFLQAQQRP
jgi:hypothetical protein